MSICLCDYILSVFLNESLPPNCSFHPSICLSLWTLWVVANHVYHQLKSSTERKSQNQSNFVWHFMNHITVDSSILMNLCHWLVYVSRHGFQLRCHFSTSKTWMKWQIIYTIAKFTPNLRQHVIGVRIMLLLQVLIITSLIQHLWTEDQSPNKWDPEDLLIYVRVDLCVYVCLYACTCVHVRADICVCVFVHMVVCVHVLKRSGALQLVTPPPSLI